MGTVRVERCPECRVLLGEGTLYEHQQRVHANPRRVPAQFSTGGDKDNAQKAWLDGFDAGVAAAKEGATR
jgi:hypothetical protein